MDFQYRVIEFLHQQFPDSLQMDQNELYNGVSYLLEKAAYYGLETEIELVNYVITGYALGLHFDTEMPAAKEVLTDAALSGEQKADWLQQWTRQLFDALAGDEPQVEKDPTLTDSNNDDMEGYLHMQADAEAFSDLAKKVIEQLIQGDTSGLRTHFSPNFLQQIGQQTFDQVCAELLVPFFATAQAPGKSTITTYTTDSFGNMGFAFYRTILEGSSEKPYIIYMVQENGRIVIANLVINKTYEDMH